MHGSITEDERNLLLEEWGKDGQFGDFSSELLLKMLELILLNALNSHLDDLLDEGLDSDVYTFLEMTRVLLYARRALRICWI